MSSDPFEANNELRKLFDMTDLTQEEALKRFNRGQARPMSIRTLKTYLAHEGARTRIRCPPEVLARFERVLPQSPKIRIEVEEG